MDAFLTDLLAFDNTFAAYQKVVDSAGKAFTGKGDFRPLVPDVIHGLPEAEQKPLYARWENFISYDHALSAWNMAQDAVRPDSTVTIDMLRSHQALLEQFLPAFGDQGKTLLKTIQEKIKSAPAPRPQSTEKAEHPVSSPQAASEQTAEKAPGIQEETPDWDFKHYMMLTKYYDDTLNRVSARCIQLGGLERTQYPFYGYVIDLLHEIITIGRKLGRDPKYDGLIRQYYKNGDKDFQKQLSEYISEFTMNAPEEMLDDEGADLKSVVRALGGLDTGPVETDIGEAPDGFDPDRDLPGAPPPPPVRKIKEMGALSDADGTGKISDLKK